MLERAALEEVRRGIVEDEFKSDIAAVGFTVTAAGTPYWAARHTSSRKRRDGRVEENHSYESANDLRTLHGRVLKRAAQMGLTRTRPTRGRR